MYRMALDQIAEQNTALKYRFFINYSNRGCFFLRLKVRENIAVTHILMGQYAEAAQTYELIVQERINYRSGFNLWSYS